MPLRALVRLWVGLALLAPVVSGCSRTGGAANAYRDEHPLPADTLQLPAATIGAYGGRFVLAQTTGPKVFNSTIANETSTTDVTNLLFTGLADLDYMTQKDVPLLAKSWELAPDGVTWTFH